MPRRQTAIYTLGAGFIALAVAQPLPASAQSILDFFFGGSPKAARQQPQQPQRAPQPEQPSALASFFADPFGLNGQQQVPPRPVGGYVSSGGGSHGAAFCVRTCDGKYFSLMSRGSTTPAQMCQAFCPAAATQVYFGSQIDYATSSNGERYPDSENAFAFRKSLRADCTCNGRSPAGLAPVDLSLDNSLRPGDVVATSNGLLAYSGGRSPSSQGEFTPVASYPGLTSDVRARLGEMKVAPATTAEARDDEARASMASPAAEVSPTARNRRSDARLPQQTVVR